MSKCLSPYYLYTFSGEKCHTSATGAGDDQFKRQASVFVARQVESGSAGERQAAADGHPAAELIAPARGIRLGRNGIRQPGPSATPTLRPAPPPAPPILPAAAISPPSVPTIEPAMPAVPAAAAHQRRRRLLAFVIVTATAPAAVAAVAVLPQVVGGQHGGRGRADRRFGRGRVRAVRQSTPDPRARVA